MKTDYNFRFAVKTLLVLAFIFSANALIIAKEIATHKIEVLNSKSSEENPVISSDGKRIFFNSARQTYPKQQFYSHDYYYNINRYDFNIYYSDLTANGWSEPKMLGNGINTDADDGVLAISNDGKTIYFISYKEDFYLDGGPLYTAEYVDGEWKNIKGMGGELSDFLNFSDYNIYNYNNDFYFTKYFMGASISSDETEFYFSTDVNRKYGDLDIWVSKKVDGKWSYPENLGPKINIKNAENIFPTISKDGKTLFYSTDGLDGFGGRDIYYSVKNENAWSNAENLGEKVNTEFDEIQIIQPKMNETIFIVRTDKENINNMYEYIIREKDEKLADILQIERKEYALKGTEVENNANSNQSIIDIKLYPNPANNLIQIEINNANAIEIYGIKIVDIYGKVLNEIQLAMKNEESMSLDISNYPEGVYLLNISTNAGYYTKKFVKA